MGMRVFLVLACALCVFAQPENPEPQQPDLNPMFGPEQMIMMQVQKEEFVSRKWLEIILKMQHAMYNMQAAQSYIQTLSQDEFPQQQQQQQQQPYGGGYGGYGGGYGSFLERESRVENLEEDELLTDNVDDFNAEDIAKGELMFAYNAFRAINIKTYQTIYLAGDVQREFFMDRVMQLRVQAAGAQLPPQLYTLLYMKTFSTFLKTLKLAYGFQVITHFRCWLEDAIDVNVAVLEDNSYAQDVVDEQEDDLIRDKMWAFSAYQQYATLDFYTFWIDMYMESILTGAGSFGGGSMGGGSMGGGSMGSPAAAPMPDQQPQGAAFLETEAEPTQSQSQFLPFLGFLGYNSSPHWYMKVYHLWYIMYQMMGARSAFGSVYAQSSSVQSRIAGDFEQAEQSRTQAKHLFSGFASCMLMSAQLEQMTAWFEMYGFFALAAGSGSFGGGSMGGGMPATAPAYPDQPAANKN